MTLPVDLEEFVTDHRPDGALTGDATEPTDNGYLVTVGCPCGVTFLRWVAPEDAAAAGLRTHLRAERTSGGLDVHLHDPGTPWCKSCLGRRGPRRRAWRALH